MDGTGLIHRNAGSSRFRGLCARALSTSFYRCGFWNWSGCSFFYRGRRFRALLVDACGFQSFFDQAFHHEGHAPVVYKRKSCCEGDRRYSGSMSLTLHQPIDDARFSSEYFPGDGDFYRERREFWFRGRRLERIRLYCDDCSSRQSDDDTSLQAGWTADITHVESSEKQCLIVTHRRRINDIVESVDDPADDWVRWRRFFDFGGFRGSPLAGETLRMKRFFFGFLRETSMRVALT